MGISTLTVAVAALAAVGITALVTGHDGVAAAGAMGGILTIAGYALKAGQSAS